MPHQRLPWILKRAALVVVLTATFSFADAPRSVGIPTAQFNFVSAAQLRPEWCWAASVQMILNWYQVPVKQSDVVDRIYHKVVNRAASEDAIAVALSGFAYDRGGRKVQMQAERRKGMPATQMLLDELGQRRPMLLTFRSTRTMMHAVVLTSAEYTRNKQGVHITALTFRDPSPTFRERRPAGALRLTGTELARFVRSVSSYYLVDINPIK